VWCGRQAASETRGNGYRLSWDRNIDVLYGVDLGICRMASIVVKSGQEEVS